MTDTTTYVAGLQKLCTHLQAELDKERGDRVLALELLMRLKDQCDTTCRGIDGYDVFLDPLSELVDQADTFLARFKP